MSRSAYKLWVVAAFAGFYLLGWWYFRPRIEADLRARTKASVSERVASLKSVEFSGRDGSVTLSAAEDSADLAQAKSAAEKVWGVRTAAVHGQPRPPVTENLHIQRSGETLRLTGRLVHDSSRAALVRELEAHFGGWQIDSSEVALSATQVSPIAELIRPFLPLLAATAPEGALDFAPGRLVLTGTVPNEAARQELQARARALPAPGFELEISLVAAQTEPAAQPKTLASAVRRELESLRLHFRWNTAALTRSAAKNAEPVLTALKSQPGLVVKIVGHTDAKGTRSYNQKLSELRANAVARWLTSAGVPADAVVIEGRGESAPEATNRFEKGRAKNRRVQFEVVGGF